MMDICRIVTVVIFILVSGLPGNFSQPIASGPSNIEHIGQSDSVSFNCTVEWSNDDTDSVVWGKYEGGRWTQLAQFYSSGAVHWVQKHESRYMIESDPSHNFNQLTVLSASLEEDGYYDCYPYSQGIPMEPHAQLVVLDEIDSLEFIEHADASVLTVNQGQDYQITCEGIAGNPPAELTWTIGGSDVTSYSTNSTTQHNDVTLFDSLSTLQYAFSLSEDNLELTCMAFQYDSLPVKTASLRLNVVELRNDTTVIGPSNVDVISVSESATFSCNVNWGSNPSDSVVWAKRVYDHWEQICQFDSSGSVKWVTQFQSSYEVGPSDEDPHVYELNVVSATLDEDAEYDCYTYSHSEPTPPHARLFVLDEIDSIQINGYTDGTSLTVNASQTYQMTCNAMDGSPPAELTWTLGDQDVTESSSATFAQSSEHPGLINSHSVLEYAFNSTDNSQNLSCHSFQHRALGNNSVGLTLNVLYSPIIHSIAVVSWKNDHSVTLECVVSANPDDITYEWSGEGGATGGNRRLWSVIDGGEDGIMTVTCKATNELGQSELTSTVSDPDPPLCNRQCIIGVIVGGILSGIMLILFIFWACANTKNKKGEQVRTKDEHQFEEVQQAV